MLPSMIKIPFKKKRDAFDEPSTSLTLSNALNILGRRGEEHRQRANLTTSPEERDVALTQAGILHQFHSRAQVEVLHGLADLQGTLSQGWVLDSIAAQRMFLRSGEGIEAPGAVEAHLEILDALEGKF